ncbi:multidrug ABC transporter permease [Burkholderia sp. WAC0059]|uniref:HlyD family secretion protein n=1 Tax=Burkholderia sp. WAC0059 TaxID=2066022 RepID=UPI000C7F4102|nr:HlyD family secretion protein [Burkholderia sp. WAC0059]PLZ04044.1 multidrug ABC transporter permease [Burkholderia sp. WAC0059]
MSATAGSPPQGAAPKDPTAAPERRTRTRNVLLVVGLIALIAGGIWLFRWWTVGRYIESTDDAYLQADSVTISPRVGGYVTAVLVGDNVAVQSGQPLVRIDTRQYQASLDQAKATVGEREADIQRAEADIAQQRANVVQARAQEEVARVNFQHAESDVRRYAPLAATGAETHERLSDLVSTRDQARATLAANTAAANAAQTQIAATLAQIDQARAQLEAAEANVRSAALDLHDTTLESPFAGRVGDRTVRIGQYVQPGTQLMTIVPVQRIYLTANFKETQVGDMRSGQSATLHVDALPGVDVHGVVDSFAPGTGSQFALLPPENATGNFTKIVQRVPVRIRIDTDSQTRERLLPGLSVTVDVDTRSSPTHPGDSGNPGTGNANHG